MPEITSVRREPLADQAAELLLQRIRAGEWHLGERLPGETTLAPQLGVGRSTVREAIRQLAGRGVLQTRQGLGVFVTALDAAEDWDRVLQRVGIVSVIEARLAIETEAAALAAQRRTPAELRALRRALAVRDTHRAALVHDGSANRSRDLEAYVDADTAFHRLVVAAAHNPILLELFDGFVPRVRQAMLDMLRLRHNVGGGDDHAAHADLLEVVAARDAAGAAELSRRHLRSLQEAIR